MSDIKQHEHPHVTVDILVFTVLHKELKVLLVQRNIEPFKDSWALPGGFVRMNESLDAAALRELREESGVKDVYLEQLYTFGEPKRDPRARVITVAYFALIDGEKIKLHATTDVSDAQWFSIKALPKLAFDHAEIFNYALQRLRWKLEYTNIVYSLLPEMFTLTQLQTVYEIILDRTLDKRNFRKKILALQILKDTKEMLRDVSHRPAKLYAFRKKEAQIVELL